jgi:cob(I)alamin adenosyltransferase
MKIYTRTGDDGTTGLLGKSRVPKHDARVEAYGSVDELNAVLGVAQAQGGAAVFGDTLPGFQVTLFQLGAELATTDAAMLAKLDRVSAEDVTALEREIDRFEGELKPLTQFVLPGGAPLAAALHHARTVCRRAERRLTALAARESVSPHLVHWLNRLADLLFVMARVANARAGVPDRAWTPRAKS